MVSSSSSDGSGSWDRVNRRRNRKRSENVTVLMSRITANTVPTPTMIISHSSTRMRTLDRWSENSLRNTAPSPVQGEPSRRIASLLEIARIDVLEAELLQIEPQQLDALRRQSGGELRADVARAGQPETAGRLGDDAPHPVDALDQARHAVADGLELDHGVAAEHRGGELAHRADQRDPPA